ncbi:MAG: Pycsar system effector family protein [Saprospiraceae bacterium]
MVQTKQNALIVAAEVYVEEFYRTHFSDKYIFHDFEHTKEVVEATKQIAAGYELSEREIEILILAAWFHDIGYIEGAEGHEERSCTYAATFLTENKYPADYITIILECIRATKIGAVPENLLEKILCDADLSHLGNKMYWEHCTRLRQELFLTQNIVMSEHDWVNFELDFITHHQYYTEVGHELFDKRKQKHIRQLIKHKMRLNPETVDLIEELEKKERKEDKKLKKIQQSLDNSGIKLKEIDLGRGVETMYRNIYRTHINLSSIADNKANIMLSVNAIIISIVISALIPKLELYPSLRIPTILLLAVCLGALVFAILATRPKVTKNKLSRTDIDARKANLLFFGNFYNMELDDFHYGMMEMIKDSDFLYSSMTRDLYYLGIVLAQKYQYLRICYGIFMYGLIVSVIVFAIAFLA